MWLYVPQQLSVCSQESAPSTSPSDESFQMLAASSSWRGKSRLWRLWRLAWKRATWMPRRFGQTFGRSQQTLSEDVLTWWQEGFPARTSASPGRAQDSQASAADSSSTSCAWFAEFDPATSFWRTSQQSLFEDSTPYSERWPKAGSMRNGRASKRPTLARLTVEIAGGASRGTENWSTPRVSAERNSRSSMTRDGHWAAPSLEQMAELSMGVLPREFESEGELTPQARRIWESGRQWSTPSVADTTGGHLSRGGNRSNEMLLRGQARAVAASLWSTPTANEDSYRLQGDSQASKMLEPQARRWAGLDSHQGQTTRTAGADSSPSTPTSSLQLNERFVEALMGLPAGWTDCAASATPSSRSRQRPPCAHCGSEPSTSGREVLP